MLALPEYPGRGLLVGRLLGDEPVVGYFVTGRSAASRERDARVDADREVRIVPTDDLSDDDELRHYVAITTRSSWTVVGNGRHVTDIADRLEQRADLRHSIEQWDVEPDAPIYTPRIIGAVTAADRVVHVGAARRTSAGTTEHVVTSEDTPAGSGLLIHTYAGSREVVTTAAEPRRVDDLPAATIALADELWGSLDPDLRVLVVTLALDESAPIVVRRGGG